MLLFGSGRVAKPVMKLFESHDNVFITIATNDLAQGQELVNALKPHNRFRANIVDFKFPAGNDLLPSLFAQCDVAISLLPATMHLPLAEEAIRQKKHFVTASYTSPAMRQLDEQAKQAGIILLNEMGLVGYF